MFFVWNNIILTQKEIYKPFETVVNCIIVWGKKNKIVIQGCRQIPTEKHDQ